MFEVSSIAVFGAITGKHNERQPDPARIIPRTPKDALTILTLTSQELIWYTRCWRNAGGIP